MRVDFRFWQLCDSVASVTDFNYLREALRMRWRLDGRVDVSDSLLCGNLISRTSRVPSKAICERRSEPNGYSRNASLSSP